MYIDHPAWQKVVVILYDPSNTDGASGDIATRPFSSPLFRQQRGANEEGEHGGSLSTEDDLREWTLKVAYGFSDMDLIRQVSERFSPAD